MLDEPTRQDKLWEELNTAAARARAELESAMKHGAHDGNAAALVRLQQLAEDAESQLLEFEAKHTTLRRIGAGTPFKSTGARPRVRRNDAQQRTAGNRESK